VFGHETAGTIVKVGVRARGFRVAERVGLHHHVPCMKCHACRHGEFAQCPQYKRTGITAGFEPAGGGYADYVRVMDFVLPGIVKIPARNSFIEGAMQEPVNTVLKAVNRLGLLRGDTVLVAGQGPIGLMFTRLLALKGMKVVASDLMAERLRLARKMGAKWVFKADAKDFAEKIQRLTDGRGMDGAVVAVPLDAVVTQAQDLVRGAGRVLLFAHTRRGVKTELDLSAICVDEKALVGSYSSDVTLQKEVARLVFSRKLDVRNLITHEFPLGQTSAAVELAAHPKANSLKIMVVHGRGDVLA
jgi:L-iditol 2-dehydrogenase